METEIEAFFKNSYFINLDHREDRLKDCLVEFERIGISPKRFPGIIVQSKSRKRRAAGCTQSHLSVLKEFRKSSYEMVTILEDDVKFRDDFKTTFPKYASELSKEDWGIFMFEKSRRARKEGVDEKMISYPALTPYPRTHAYTVRRKVIDKVIFLYEDSLILNKKGHVNPIDRVLIQNLEDLKIYAPNKPLAFQRRSFSDICRRITT